MDTDAILTLLQDVAEEVINPRFRALADAQVLEKSPGDLVTVADREAEVLITRQLEAAYPEALVLGEEAFAADPGLLDLYAAAAHTFTVDPIDGTKNFVHGKKDHAVMVAEQRDGQTVRSWIWQPQHAVAYVAERGAGAYRNDERLLRPAVEGAPRGVTSHRRWLGESLGQVPAAGSGEGPVQLPPLELTWVCCGVDYPKLVEGAADYIVYRGTKPWDHAPGALLLSEAGAYLGSFGGQDYDPMEVTRGGLLGAADRQLYESLQPLLPVVPQPS